MAANLFSSLFCFQMLLIPALLLSSSAASSSSSHGRRLLQSNSDPRNLRTFFPSSSFPAFNSGPSPTSPPLPPAATSTPPPPPPPPRRTTNIPVIVATAATTFVISGIFFFAVQKFTFKRRRVQGADGGDAEGKFRQDRVSASPYNAAAAAVSGGSPVKAVVVDEGGHNVLYWRGTGEKRCSHCMGPLDSDDRRRSGGRTAVGGGGRKARRMRQNDGRIQEMPLIYADSLSSPDRIVQDWDPNWSETSSSQVFSLPAPVEEMQSTTSSVAPSSPRLPLPPARRKFTPLSPTPPRGRPSLPPHTRSEPALSSPPSHPPSPPPPPQPVRSMSPPPPPQPQSTPPPQPPSAPPPPQPVRSMSPPPPPQPQSTPPPQPPSAPPPPKPPGAPPPPPGVKKTQAPPPPPPPRNPTAPPPPPLRGSPSPSRPPPVPLSALGKSAATGSEGGKGQSKLKPLHWDKITTANADHSMVWDKIKDGSFRVDDEMMEALFGTAAAKRSPDGKRTTLGNPSPAQISLLDPRKSQNIAIVIRSLGITHHDIIHTLTEGRGLNAETLEKLSRIAPSDEEQTQILDFPGNPSDLADAESFLHRLLKAVNSPFVRIDAMLFRCNYEPEVSHVRASLRTLENACTELRGHVLFPKLLEAILKAGNRMNAGTARGNAQAFNLSSLTKLSDVKSTDGKTTLLHFVVEEVTRSEGKRFVINRNHSLRRIGSSRSVAGGGAGESSAAAAARREEKEREYMMLGLPVVGGLSVELANVKKAAAVDYDALVKSCSDLGRRLAETGRFLGASDGLGGFAKRMSGFVEKAEEEMKGVREEQGRVMDLVKKTTEYFQAGASKEKSAAPLQLFVIVKDFLVMVDRVCVDVTRNLQQQQQQKKKTIAAIAGAAAAGSSPPATPDRRSPARFPNLPPHFMSDISRTSSNSGSDSEDEF